MAYYYDFEPTGNPDVDVILEAVSKAGKAFHHTSQWNDEVGPMYPGMIGQTPVDWIQNAANKLAQKLENQAK